MQLCSLRTTKRVSEGLMFLRRSSSLRLILPSPLAHSARNADETLSTALRNNYKEPLQCTSTVVEFKDVLWYMVESEANDEEEGEEVGKKRKIRIALRYVWR